MRDDKNTVQREQDTPPPLQAGSTDSSLWTGSRRHCFLTPRNFKVVPRVETNFLVPVISFSQYTNFAKLFKNPMHNFVDWKEHQFFGPIPTNLCFISRKESPHRRQPLLPHQHGGDWLVPQQQHRVCVPASVSDPDSFFTDPDPDPGFFSQSGSGSGSRSR